MPAILSENHINDTTTWQFPSEAMQTYSITQDFMGVLEPVEVFEYKDLQALLVAKFYLRIGVNL